MITLLVGFPQSEHAGRVREYDYCLSRNCANDKIDHVIIVEEEPGSRAIETWAGACPPTLRPGKVDTVKLGKRATYADYIAIANKLCGVILIANADIVFNYAVELLDAIPDKTLCAITRLDSRIGLCPSADAWAFRPPLEITDCDWHLGRLACDFAFTQRISALPGWTLWNPCFEVPLKHIHASQIRSELWKCWVPHDASLVYPRIVRFDRKTRTFHTVSWGDVWKS